jgi:hypothetical protein
MPLIFRRVTKDPLVVKIRDDLNGGKYYDCVYFNERMNKFRGKIAKITKNIDGHFNLDIDKGKWTWSKEMFVNK